MITDKANQDVQIVFVIPYDIGGWGHHGVAMLSACLKEKGFCRIVVLPMHSPEVFRLVRTSSQVLVAFSTLTPYADQYLDLAVQIKKNFPHAVTAFGGPHPSVCPEIIEHEAVDAVCIGEAEEAFPEFMQTYDFKEHRPRRSVANWWIKDGSRAILKLPPRSVVMDLDSLPWADREVLSRGRFPKNQVQWFTLSRRCFCGDVSHPGFIRRRSVDSAIREIRSVLSRYGGRVVRFQDEVFANDLQWREEFSFRYKQTIGLPFGCSTDAGVVSDRYVSTLRKAGCVFIKLNESEDFTLYAAAASLIKRQRVKLGVSVFLGVPDSDPEYDVRKYEFIKRLCPDSVHSQVFSNYSRAQVREESSDCVLSKYAVVYYNIYWPVVDVQPIQRNVMHLVRIQAIFNLSVYWRLPVFMFKALSMLPVDRYRSGINFLAESAPFLWVYFLYIFPTFSQKNFDKNVS